MDPNNPIVKGLEAQSEKSHVKMSIGLNWPDLIKFRSDRKGWFIPFCNPNERTCNHLIGFKTETGKYCACAVI